MNGRNSALGVILGLLVVMLIGVFAWIFIVPTRDTTQRSIEQIIANKEPIRLRLISPTSVWLVGNQYEVRVDLDKSSEDSITAVNVQLHYDPELVEIVEVKNGNVWTKTDVLSLAIDNDFGEAFASFAKAFDGNLTENRSIAIFVMQPKNLSLNKTKLTLGDRSIVAVPGSNNTTVLESPELSLTLTI